MSDQSQRRSALSTILVMACTFASRILGFVRTAAIGALFGAGGVADVIHLVFNIPNNLRKLLAEGALSTAFIPVLSREISRDPGGTGAPRLARSILGLQILIIIPILVISLFMPELVLSLFERFEEPEKRALSVLLFRWMMPYLLLVSVSAVMMAVHNSHDWFFVPAVTPVVFSVCVIGALFLGYRSMGAVSIGVGVLFGGAAQIAVQYPTYRKLGYRLAPSFSFQYPAFKSVMRRWLPMLVTSSLFVVNNQVAMFIASFLPDKSASSLANAIVFFQLPFGIFSASITTVLYPKMSRQAASGDTRGLLGSLSFGYRNLWALLLPSAAALILLGAPVISIAFQRRAFTVEDTLMTARVLAAYSVGMPFVGLFNITQRALYSLGEVKRPFYCALGTVIIDIVFSLVFVMVAGGGSVSLAWANSIAFIAGSSVQYMLMKKITGFSLKGLTIRTFGKVIAATAAGGVVMGGSRYFFGENWWASGSSWTGLGLFLAIVLASAAVILGIYSWLKVEAVSIIFKRGVK